MKKYYYFNNVKNILLKPDYCEFKCLLFSVLTFLCVVIFKMLLKFLLIFSNLISNLMKMFNSMFKQLNCV